MSARVGSSVAQVPAMTKAILSAALAALAFAGCANDQLEDRVERDDDDLLSEQADGKADGYSACGDACGEWRCGYEWAAGKVYGSPVCFGDDSDAATRLAFSMSGSESASFDTRNVPFKPVLRLDRVYMYGLDIWNFGTRSGFELLFRDITKGAFVLNGAHNKGISLALYTKEFTGPGEYTAEVGITMSSERTTFNGPATVGNHYSTRDGCKLKVEANTEPQGGFRGSFNCANVANKEGNRAIRLSGEFLIPATAVDQTMIVAKPLQ